MCIRDRPQVAATDADVDDVGDGPIGAHTLGVGQHAVQHLVHVVAEGASTAGGAQRGVQHGTAFGDVGDVAAQQGVTLLGQLALFGHLQQQRQGRLVDQVLGQIGKDLGRLQAQAIKARGIGRKGLAQVQRTAALRKVGMQRVPGRCVITACHFSFSSMMRSSLRASAAKARMPSASFSVAIASSFSAQRKDCSSWCAAGRSSARAA